MCFYWIYKFLSIFGRVLVIVLMFNLVKQNNWMDWMQVFLRYVTLSGGRGNHKYILPIVVGQSVWILRSIHQKLMFWIDSYTQTNQLFASKLLFICRRIGYISKIHGQFKHVQYLGWAKKCHVSVPLVEKSVAMATVRVPCVSHCTQLIISNLTASRVISSVYCHFHTQNKDKITAMVV